MPKPTVILDRKFFPKGGLIVQVGQFGDCAYLIQSGSVEVFAEHNSKEVLLATLGAGQIFGEMALILDEPQTRAASVRALSDVNLIVITRQTFLHKLEKTDATIRAVMEMLTRRMITTNSAVVDKKNDAKDLMESAQAVYRNIYETLPQDSRKAFQAQILPMLDDFMNAIKDFES